MSGQVNVSYSLHLSFPAVLFCMYYYVFIYLFVLSFSFLTYCIAFIYTFLDRYQHCFYLSTSLTSKMLSQDIQRMGRTARPWIL